VGVVVLVVVVRIEVASSFDVVSHPGVIGYIASFVGASPNTLKEILSPRRLARYVLDIHIYEGSLVPVSLDLLNMREVNSTHLICLTQSYCHPN